jgi:hypothetical protein
VVVTWQALNVYLTFRFIIVAASLGFGAATDAGDTESEGGDTESAGYNSESDVGQPSPEVGGRRRTIRRMIHRE